MKFQIENTHPLIAIKDKKLLTKLAAHRLVYDFVENLPEEQFNSVFNTEILEPTEEALQNAFETKQWPLFRLLELLKKYESFQIHLHINI